jgi:D-3-phosphoglycerate dehydrogenase
MSKVYITDYITDPVVEKKILSDHFVKDIKNKDIEVILVWNQVVDDEFLNKFPKLKGIVRYGVGYDKINIDAVKKRNLVVCNTPDYAMEEVSDTALGMLLNITRALNLYDHISRKSLEKWKQNTPIKEIKRNKINKIGVIGAGRIGSLFIKKAESIGFEVHYFDPYLKENINHGSRVKNLDELLSLSDIISIHTPLTDETFGLVDESFLSRMKTGSSIINTARGKIIKNLDIIYDCLKSNKLYSIAFDVLPDEPPHKSKLISSWLNRDEISPRILINPHVSYYSNESFIECREKASFNALSIINNNEPKNIIYDFRK